jgi:hypothetical protein
VHVRPRQHKRAQPLAGHDSIDAAATAAIVPESYRTTAFPIQEKGMGANHAGERKRRKLKNTKKIIRTQMKKAKAK